jgi:hypothetical protein
MVLFRESTSGRVSGHRQKGGSLTHDHLVLEDVEELEALVQMTPDMWLEEEVYAKDDRIFWTIIENGVVVLHYVEDPDAS